MEEEGSEAHMEGWLTGWNLNRFIYKARATQIHKLRLNSLRKGGGGGMQDPTSAGPQPANVGGDQIHTFTIQLLFFDSESSWKFVSAS